MDEQRAVPGPKSEPTPGASTGASAGAGIRASETDIRESDRDSSRESDRDPIRASDADRGRIADILRKALTEGRLDADEHAERLDASSRARTRGELEHLVRDLPTAGRGAVFGREVPAYGHGGGQPATGYDGPGPTRTGAAPASENLVAVFGGAVRKGRWRVGRRTNAFAVFGGVEIDLTEAIFERQEIVVNASAIFGGVEIKVPENVSLRGSGTGVFGGFDVAAYDAPDPQAPVIVVSGFAIFGGVEAKPVRGKRLRNLRAG